MNDKQRTISVPKELDAAVNMLYRKDAYSPGALPIDLSNMPSIYIVRLWWEYSSIYGLIFDIPRFIVGGVIQNAILDWRLLITHSQVSRPVHNLLELENGWCAKLAAPPTIESHYENIRTIFHGFFNEENGVSDEADALLRLHTDLSASLLDGRLFLDIAIPEAVPRARAELEDLQEVFRDLDSFIEHIRRGCDSTSLARKDLSWRLTNL